MTEIEAAANYTARRLKETEATAVIVNIEAGLVTNIHLNIELIIITSTAITIASLAMGIAQAVIRVKVHELVIKVAEEKAAQSLGVLRETTD